VIGDSLRVTCGQVARRVAWGTSYADVEPGKLVAFLTADGTLRVAVNMGNAARRLKCHVGEPVEIAVWIARTQGKRYH